MLFGKGNFPQIFLKHYLVKFLCGKILWLLAIRGNLFYNIDINLVEFRIHLSIELKFKNQEIVPLLSILAELQVHQKQL